MNVVDIALLFAAWFVAVVIASAIGAKLALRSFFRTAARDDPTVRRHLRRAWDDRE